MQMTLSLPFSIHNPFLHNLLRLLDKLSMEINRILRHPSIGVILAEDEVGGLFIVCFHALPVFAVGFGARQVPETIVFYFCVLGLIVVEGWGQPQRELAIWWDWGGWMGRGREGLGGRSCVLFVYSAMRLDVPLGLAILSIAIFADILCCR